MGNNQSKRYLTNNTDLNNIILNYMYQIDHYERFKPIITAFENTNRYEKKYDDSMYEIFINLDHKKEFKQNLFHVCSKCGEVNNYINDRCKINKYVKTLTRNKYLEY